MVKKKESEFLTEDEVKMILKLPDRMTHEGKRDYALLLLMVTTGLRKAEVCSLKFESIKTYKNQLCLDLIGKGKRHRRVPLRVDVLKTIQEYWKAMGDDPGHDDPIFKTLGKYGPHKVTGISRVAIDGVIHKYAKLSLIRKRITPHTLRHTFATSILSNGTDLKTTQELLGHSSISTTEKYLHSNDEKKFQAVDLLNFIKG